jgi:hypothetical protein
MQLIEVRYLRIVKGRTKLNHTGMELKVQQVQMKLDKQSG